MKHDPHHKESRDLHRPLVTVERQYETDLATGKTQGRMFVKMYFDARDSGLLAAMPGELWKMLCCLATYMDENGNCCPSQGRIAHDLGVSRQRVNERIQALSRFEFQGAPVIRIVKATGQKGSAGRWDRNQYRIHPIASFGIFDDQRKAAGAPQDTLRGDRVRESGHGTEIAVSGTTDTVNPDTNKNQSSNQNTRVAAKAFPEGEAQARELARHFHCLLGHPEGRLTTRKEIVQAEALISEHGQETARAIVAFAVREAESTRFQMVYFGAVLAYTEAALADLHDRDARARGEDLRLARLAYDRFRTEAIAKHRAALPMSELALLEADARSRAPESSRKLGLVGGWVRLATDDAIARRLEIPEFETWVARTKPAAKSTATPAPRPAA
jgi:hypothetical protein